MYTSFLLYKSRVNKHGQSPVLMRITIDGLRETVSTGISVAEKYWDDKKGQLKGNSQEIITQNNLLSSLQNKALSAYTELFNGTLPISSAAIKAKLLGQNQASTTLLQAIVAHNAHVRKKVGVQTAKATLTKYETLRSKLEAYIPKQYRRKDVLLKELNHSFVANFELYLSVEEKIGHNTTIKYIQSLKRIINFAIVNDWLQNDPFKAFKCPLKPVVRECLTMSEIQAISAKEFQVERLRQVKDCFIFSCYTGLAYTDLKALRMGDIRLGVDDKLWIYTARNKTKTQVHVPLLPQAIAIVDSYAEWRKETNTDRVLPVVSNQKINAYLKEIADVCGITKKLTFHIARHSFATSVTLNNGVPIEVVSKLLGHTNIKTTQIYAKVQDVRIAGDISALDEKLNRK